MRCVRLLAFGVLAACPCIGDAARVDELRIGGSGSALGAMRLVAEAFARDNRDLVVRVLPSVGTNGAFRAVPRGALDIGLATRVPTPQEHRLGANAVEYARTPLVLAVAAGRGGVTALTLDQVAGIYSGRIVSWPDGQRIRPVLREPGDDGTHLLGTLSPAVAAAIVGSERLRGMPFAATAQEAADKTQNVPGALGIVTVAQIVSEGRALQALWLDGVEPTLANGASGAYPCVSRLFLVTRAYRSEPVKRFVAFTQSSAGREILVRAGHWIP